VTVPRVGYQNPTTVTIQPDGKLVVVGRSETDSLVARFESDGRLDTGFGSGGVVVYSFSSGNDDDLRDVAVQADGKIVAVGITTPPGLTSGATFLIARFEGKSGPGFQVSPTSGLITTEAGGTASFTVVLTTQT
jgi:uncharacterized delta-60 repeat protein